MEKNIDNRHKRWPAIFSIPVFILLSIVFWKVGTGILNIIMFYIGGWGMILTLPIVFCLIIGPLMDALLGWHDKKFS